MAKKPDRVLELKPLLVRAESGYLLLTPHGDGGEFETQSFKTSFRAGEWIGAKRLGPVEEIEWKALSSYMRLLPR